MKEFDEFVLYIDDVESFRGESGGDRDGDNDSGLSFEFNIANGLTSFPSLSVNLIEMQTTVKLPSIQNNIYCNSISGKVVLTNNLFGYTIYATVTNLSNNILSNYQGVSPLNINLADGVYQISYYISDGITLLAYGKSSVEIGNLLEWDMSSATNNTYVKSTQCLVSSPLNTNGTTNSINSFSTDANEWLSFKVKFYKQTGTFPMFLPKWSKVSLVNKIGTELVNVRIDALGHNIGGYVSVSDDANTIYYSGTVKPNDKVLIQNTPNGSGGEIKVFINGTQVGTSINLSSGIELFVKGSTGNFSGIYDVYNSFCYPIPDQQFVKLNRNNIGGFFIASPDDIIRVKYKEEYMDLDGNLNYKVIDNMQNVVLSSLTTPINVNYGDNRILFDISSLVNSSYYTLKVINDKNEMFNLRFKKFGI